ncbi:MAG: alpha/beta family hydrolase [Saccharospirillum sp.]
MNDDPDQSEEQPMIMSGPQDGPLLILAHGAGAPMDSDFMNTQTAMLNDQGIRVGRFEFPYMAERRTTGKKRPPDKAPKLLAYFQEVLAPFEGQSVFIGGKSMGGRMATMVAAQRPVQGVCVLGYPFHAPGKDVWRTEHFSRLTCPVLICQGERDPMGRREEVERQALGPVVHLHWLADGNHDLAPRKASGLTAEQNLASAALAISAFIEQHYR